MYIGNSKSLSLTNREEISDFRRRTISAVNNKQDTVFIQGNELDTEFARYLLGFTKK